MSLLVIPSASPNRTAVTSVLKEPALEIITTPRASIPTKRSPIAVSSLTGARSETNVTRPLITSAATNAPNAGSKPHRTANATPGITPWASASPRNESPRNTIHVPTKDVAMTAMRPPMSALCMNVGSKASMRKLIYA